MIGLSAVSVGVGFVLNHKESSVGLSGPEKDSVNKSPNEGTRKRILKVTGSRDLSPLKEKSPKVNVEKRSNSSEPFNKERIKSRSSGNLSGENPRTSKEIGQRIIPSNNSSPLVFSNVFIRKWPNEYYTWNNKKQWKYRKMHSGIQ